MGYEDLPGQTLSEAEQSDDLNFGGKSEGGRGI
jgi:hypothetical protein